MRRFASSVLMLLLLAVPLHGQEPGTGPGVIQGLVLGDAGQPLSGATVAVRSLADSAVVGGKITGQDGRFRVEDLAPGRYLVQVSALGFAAQTREVEVTAGSPTVELGEIRLTQAVVTLQGVSVKAERPAVQMLADRTVYSTSEMPVASGGTATEALRTVPELEVDADGKITSRGTTPQIHINGRPAPMQGEALQNYLQQLPANRIDRIEVIPNPSAKYDAEGQGGIVNIVMKEGTSLGLSGSLSANSGTQGSNGASARLNYQEGRLTFFGGLSLNLNHSEYSNTDQRENLITDPITFLNLASEGENRGSFGGGDLTAEYKVSKRGTVWLEARENRFGSDGDALTAYTLMDELRAPTERYDRQNENSNSYQSASASVGYRHVVQAQRDEWSVELRSNWNRNDNGSESSKLLRALTGEALDLPQELTINDGREGVHDLSLQADLARPWRKTGKVEVGYRGQLRNTEDDRTLDVFPSAGAPEPSASTPSAFDYREELHAVYLTLSGSVGRLGLQGGVRAEHAETRFRLPLSSESFGNRYDNLFPNANVSFDLKHGKQLRLSYSRRLDRPWPWILNPFNPSTDPLNRMVGNPHLRPRYTHSASLDASWNGSVGSLRLSPYYRYTTNDWNQLKSVDTAGVSTVSWFNLASIRNYGSSLSASLRPTGPFSGFASVSVYREVRDASNLATDYSGSSLRWSTNTNLTVRASSSLNLQAYGSYFPARDLPQGRISGMLYSSVGIRKQLFDDKVNVNLSLTDPFKLYHVTFTTRDATHMQRSRSSYSLRRAVLSVTYNFGRPPQSARRRPTDDQAQPPQQEGPIH
jgi:outer membrane cobalamin receptor